MRAAGRRLSARWSQTAALAGAVLVVLCFVKFGFEARAFVSAFFVAALAVLAAFDLEHRLIPNRIVLPAAVAVLVANVAIDPGRSLEWTLAALGASLFLLVPALVYPVGLGMGDVKLALLLGAALGWAVASAIVVAFVCAGLYGIALMLRRGLGARKATIAFGPFLALGGIVTLFLS